MRGCLCEVALLQLLPESCDGLKSCDGRESKDFVPRYEETRYHSFSDHIWWGGLVWL